MQPAKTSISKDIHKILVLNNWSIKHKNGFFYKSQEILYSIDTISSQKIVDNLTTYLYESPRIDTAIRIPYMYFREQNDLLKQTKFEDIDILCRIYNTDAVLSLEGFSIVDSLVKSITYDGFSYTSQNVELAYQCLSNGCNNILI